MDNDYYDDVKFRDVWIWFLSGLADLAWVGADRAILPPPLSGFSSISDHMNLLLVWDHKDCQARFWMIWDGDQVPIQYNMDCQAPFWIIQDGNSFPFQFNVQTSEFMRNLSSPDQHWEKYHRWTIFWKATVLPRHSFFLQFSLSFCNTNRQTRFNLKVSSSRL